MFLIFFIIGCIKQNLISGKFLHKRAIGGTSVNIEEFPYQVSLIYKNDHICGGSIIDNKHILTAAHCTIDKKTEDLRIRAGSSIVNKGGIVIDVLKKHEHPNYNFPLHMDYDIAILKLKNTLNFTDKIFKISLPLSNSKVPDGTYGDVTGWGTLSENSSVASTYLQHISVPTINRKKCQLVFSESEITANIICAGFSEGGKDPCSGDSGGAFNVNGTIIGIIAWGEGCAHPNSPGVYINVPKNIDFINSYLNSSSTSQIPVNNKSNSFSSAFWSTASLLLVLSGFFYPVFLP